MTNDDPSFFTHSLMVVPVGDGWTQVTAAATVSNKHTIRRLEVTACSRVPLLPRLTWPIPREIAHLALVDPAGIEVAYADAQLQPVAIHPLEVLVESGVWTEIPDAQLEVFHETGVDVKVIAHDSGEVTGLHNLRGLSVRAAPDRDYDDTYDD